MHLGKNNPKHQYTINDSTKTHILEETIFEKDMGVYVNNILFFEDHVTLTAKKARSRVQNTSDTCTSI